MSMNPAKLLHKTERLVRRLRPMHWGSSTPNSLLAETVGARPHSDIHDHLHTLFSETVRARPRLIVELGTRGGLSTRALLAAAVATNAIVLSVDIVDCSTINIPDDHKSRWTFCRFDDVAFAGGSFELFCQKRGLEPIADVIFIDTSHEYEHTKRELEAWLPRLSERGTIMFHDTNAGNGWYRSLNGKAYPGGIGTRGVMQAIEEHLGRSYDETTLFTDMTGGFIINHVPWSSGFLTMQRL